MLIRDYLGKNIISVFSVLMVCLLIINTTCIYAFADDGYDLPSVPSQGTFKSYLYYTSITAKNTPNYAVAHGTTYNGVSYNTKTDSSTGIRMVDDCYCAAIASYFSKGVYSGNKIGSKFVVYLDSGKSFKIIWTDEKKDSETDAKYHLYHKDKSIVEFVTEKSKMPAKVKLWGSYNAMSQFKGKIIRVVPENKAIDNNQKSTTVGVKTNVYKTIESSPEFGPIHFVSSSDKPFDGNVDKVLDKINEEWNENNNNGNIVRNDVAGEIANTGAGTLAYPTPSSYHSISAGYPNYSNGSYHGGIDFPCPSGTKIFAAEAGEVIIAKNLNYSYGHYIIIKHSTLGLETLYAHNTLLLVTTGQHVERGQIIALSGSTGNSTGPHCHFEVRVNGTRVNPKDYL